MQPVRTQWHKIQEAIKSDNLHFTCPKQSTIGGDLEVAEHYTKYHGDRAYIEGHLKQWDNLPRFVIDPELIELATDKEFLKSVWDMKRAGVMRLPFPAMVIELPRWFEPTDSGGQMVQTAVLLRDLSYMDTVFPWERSDELDKFRQGKEFYGIVVSLNRDIGGDYTVISPSVCAIVVGMNDTNSDVMIGSTAINWGAVPENKETNDLIGKTYQKDTAFIVRGLFCSLLLMTTDGVAREEVEVQKLNKKRSASGKPSIPHHTYIHIGKVYKSASGNDADTYVPRKSPRPHWRRGHLRNVRYGTGREKVKQVYINPRLVAFHGDVLPVTPTYEVRK